MRKIQEKDICNQELALYKSENIFKNKPSSDSTEDNFSFSTRCLQSLLAQANLNWFLLDSLNIQLQTHSLTNSLLWAYCVIVQIHWGFEPILTLTIGIVCGEMKILEFVQSWWVQGQTERNLWDLNIMTISLTWNEGEIVK